MKIPWRNPVLIVGAALLTCAAIFSFWTGSRSPEPPGELLRSEFPRSALILRDGTLFAPGESRPFCGRLVENFGAGRRKLEIEISEGKAHGRSRGWYESGQLEVHETFLHGVSHGQRTRWHPNGKRKSLAQIEAGKIEGSYTEWYDNGQKAVEMNLVRGRPEGLAEAWHRPGSLKSRVHFVHGKQVSREFWDESGKAATPLAGSRTLSGVMDPGAR